MPEEIPSKFNKKRMSDALVLPVTLWILALCWMGLIFFLSSQNGGQTAKTSSGLAEKAAEVIYTQPTIQQISRVHVDLRKAAHIGLFFALGMLIYAAVKATFSFLNKKNVWLPGVIAAVLTSSCGFFDEWNKQFIAGRHFNTGETLLNVFCGIIGMALTAAILFLYARRNFDKEVN